MFSFFELQQSFALEPAIIIPPTHTPQAAVAMILTLDGQLLMMKRAQRKGDPWSGHMAFPGGRLEEGDRDLQHTAQRETYEEVAIDLQEAAVLLGRMDDLMHPKIHISAFVYGLEKSVNPKGNHEVQQLYWFSLAALANGENRGTLRKQWNGQSYVFPLIGLQGTEIWGISLQFIDALIGRLGPRSLL